jgi:hypothetical protein
MREVLDALDWVRLQMMRRGSPDFIRQRLAEAPVRELCSRLAQTGGPGERAPSRQRKTPLVR